MGASVIIGRMVLFAAFFGRCYIDAIYGSGTAGNRLRVGEIIVRWRTRQIRVVAEEIECAQIVNVINVPVHSRWNRRIHDSDQLTTILNAFSPVTRLVSVSVVGGKLVWSTV